MTRHAGLRSLTHPRAARPALSVLDGMELALSRVHELCGPARRTLALAVAAACDGPILWITSNHASEQLNGEGVMSRIDPGRLLLVQCRRPEELLWAMEEALRSGAVPLVVADLPDPPGLTPVRRLHLAAETGTTEGSVRPLGLVLTPGDGGAQGIESRWHMAPDHRPGQSRWQLERRRARNAPPATWALGQARDGRSDRLRLAPAPAAPADHLPTKSGPDSGHPRGATGRSMCRAPSP